MTTPIDTTDDVATAVQAAALDIAETTLLSRNEAMHIAIAAIQAHNKAMAEAVPEVVNDGDERLPMPWYEGFNEARRLFLGEEA